jgi:UDP-xylose/UDP-N-acetylglucosamine transporter B4
MTGLVILFTAQIFSAIMGLYIEETYSKYGRHWREGFFYSHFLSLPLFLPFFPSMYHQYQRLAASPPVDLSALQPLHKTTRFPIQLVLLAINSITQYACIRGVNLLASKSSALTVTIVLNIRKLASLLLSIWLFGNRLAPGVLLGASIVFGSGALYGWESQRTKTEVKEQDDAVVDQFEKKS